MSRAGRPLGTLYRQAAGTLTGVTAGNSGTVFCVG